MHGNILVGQSGGPTAVINASLAGVLRAARTAGFGDGDGSIYGMRFAIEGFLEDRLLDLGTLSPNDIERLRTTPGSALGSCRYKLADKDLPRIKERLERWNVRYLFYIGGNDTMDTIHRIVAYCDRTGYTLQGIGIPKTVDNDLFATDHTPGYPSAARYVVLSVQQAGRLAADMQRVDRFVIHQTVGRDAGWLAAASAVARRAPDEAPHLIYVPERPLTREGVLADVERTISEYGWASIVVGEGIVWEDGTPVSAAASRDRFDNVEFGAMSGSSAAVGLHRLISEKTGYRGEFQIPESMAMAAADRVVELDRMEAYGCGVEAVSRAMRGENNVMVTIERAESRPYRVRYGAAPLSDVAARAKPMPSDMLAPAWVSDRFLAYVRPLIGPLDRYIDLGALAPAAVERAAGRSDGI